MGFQAVIKSAASAASLGTKSRKPRSRGVPDDGARWDDGDGRATGDGRTTERGTPLDLGFLDLVPREAALAADLITA